MVWRLERNAFWNILPDMRDIHFAGKFSAGRDQAFEEASMKCYLI